MDKMSFTERNLKRKKLQLDVEIAELEIVKREAELDLIKEELKTKKTSRWIMRVTAMITGLTLLTTIMKYMGLFTGK